MPTPCQSKCEIYSRVTGYMRPVTAWNKGKQEEFKDRKTYKADAAPRNKTSCPCGQKAGGAAKAA